MKTTQAFKNNDTIVTLVRDEQLRELFFTVSRAISNNPDIDDGILYVCEGRREAYVFLQSRDRSGINGVVVVFGYHSIEFRTVVGGSHGCAKNTFAKSIVPVNNDSDMYQLVFDGINNCLK